MRQDPASTSPGQAPPAPEPLLPVVSLPKGGGAIQGIGEAFAVNPANGTCSFSIPLPAPAGRGGFGPALSLAYDSGSGNGPFGLGWSVAVPAVSRRTDRGVPRYRDGVPGQEDTFLLAGAEDLVPTLAQTAAGWNPDERTEVEGADTWRVRRYRPRTESSHDRIERWTHAATGDAHWRVLSRENTWSVFGASADARIADPADPSRVFSWLLEETRDDRGNVVRYTYRAEDGAGVDAARPHEHNRPAAGAQRYLKGVEYGNTVPGEAADFVFRVVLDYGDHGADAPAPEPDRPWTARPDAFSAHRAGFEVRTRRLCRRVLVFHDFHELGPAPRLVRSVDLRYEERADATRLAGARQRGYVPGRAPDETPEVRFAYTEPQPDGVVRTADAADLPEGVDGSRWNWVDLDGEGLAGVLSRREGAWFYAPNRGGGRIGPIRLVAQTPASAGPAQVVDLRGDGRAHLVAYAGETAGSFARAEAAPGAVGEDETRGWEPFRPFESLPRLDWADPNLRWVDVDGDGRADVLIAGDDLFTWYRSRGEAGFAGPEQAPRPGPGADEERGPAIVFANEAECIHLADMDGDGLTDIVRVRNGDVSYWPNLGHGRFGPRVAMDAAPAFDHPDAWDPRRLRLADVDGSGTTDLLYLGGGGVRYWTNQAGNGWTVAREVPAFPAVDGQANVAVTDLLGSGTACLVWSSGLPGHAGRALRYVDLAGGKPHLLRAVENGRGGETRIEYAPSTRFYLQDRAAGRPWASRLPFPVQVVARTEALDHVTGHRMATRYAYAHGAYDGGEREFRGFGRVDQWDAEAWSGDPLDQPPVHTRTWFHTGLWNPEGGLAQRYAAEFWAGDARAWARPESVLPAATRPAEDPSLAPAALSAAELREASRALRGKVLRQETYGEDGAPRSIHPYTVSEHAYVVECLQPRGAARHAVFAAQALEARTWQYERDPADPRVSQALTLEVDAYGAVLRSAAVAHPRRVPDGPAAAEQARTWITVTDVRVANEDAHADWRRIGVPVESTAWELTGVPRPATGPFSAGALRQAMEDAAEIPYEALPSPGIAQKRAVQRTRNTYWADDLSGPLPPGRSGRRALPHEAYTAAFTPGLIASVFGGRVTADDLSGEGGYRLADGTWWSRSGWAEHDPARFYLPVAATDPWGNRSRIEYDAYALFVTAAHDALPAPRTNTVRARTHYRALQPWLMTDASGNRTALRFDGLGRVTATALMGKPGAGEGDALDLAMDERSDADAPTTHVTYDDHAWERFGAPCRVRAKDRETHGDPASRWMETVAYGDGLGREVLRKTRAEPGLAPHRGAAGALARGADGPPLRRPLPRWVGSGRVVLNNKGNPVRRYPPYFAHDDGFDGEDGLGAGGMAEEVRYDAPGRAVGMESPDGTFTRTELGPWSQAQWDAGDTVLESRWYAERIARPAGDPERRAAEAAAAYAGTPLRTHHDSLGHVVVADAWSDAATLHRTRTALDVEGNALAVTDARGNVVLRQRFDLAGRAAHAWSADGTETRTLADPAGKPLRAWKGTGTDEVVSSHAYDALRRPVLRRLRDASGRERVAELTVYGERLPDAAARNLRGKPFRVYDGAGLAATARCDFAGRTVESSRVLAREYRRRPDWSPLAPLRDVAELDAAGAALLEDEAFTTRTEYDALGRPVRLAHPDGSALLPGYNQAGLLDRVWLEHAHAGSPIPYVTDVQYDALGQRRSIEFPNGVRTEYAYDPWSLRLTGIRTRGGADGALLQDLAYTWDPAGNVAEIADGAQQTVFFDNAVVSPSTRYVYDARYRLVRAEGREHAGAGPPAPGADGFPLHSLPHANDASALRRYVEDYTYDLAGNLQRMVHHAGGGVAWRRDYAYGADSNRLESTAAGGVSSRYAHDAFGNLAAMPHLRSLGWDEDDRLHAVDRDSVRTFYTYDAAGQRVRKMVEKNDGGTVQERVYLGGFEVYREHAAGRLELRRDTIHLLDGTRRIALVETLVHGGRLPAAPLARYTLDNHLGSCALELDDAGRVISYEEYHPYGSTSYRSAAAGKASLKRYRYSGKEHDDESGFYYHGARYYAPWLGRWTSPDPAGLADGPNRYAYVSGNPVVLRDPDGRSGKAAVPGGIEQKITRPGVISVLKMYGLPYAEEVTFTVNIGGKVIEGRWDVVFIDPRNGAPIIPELKGARATQLHTNQPLYLPVLESEAGATVTVTGQKGARLSLKSTLHVSGENYFRVHYGKMGQPGFHLDQFVEGLGVMTGGEKMKHQVFHKGEFRFFKNKGDLFSYLRNEMGMSPKGMGAIVAGGLMLLGSAADAAEFVDTYQTMEEMGGRANQLSADVATRGAALQARTQGRTLERVKGTHFMVDMENKKVVFVDSDVYGRQGSAPLGAQIPVNEFWWDTGSQVFRWSDEEQEKCATITNWYPGREWNLNIRDCY